MQRVLATVGVFDSGVGGLSVLRHMLDVPNPPWDRVIYLADLAHFPYGPRPSAEVRDLALTGIGELAARGASVVAVACNTAASSGVRAGLTGTPVPILDVIGPGAREVAGLAAAHPGSRVIVLGTEGTVRNRVWERALREAGFAGPIVGWPCPFLANLIEEGRNGLVAKQAVFDATRGLAGFEPAVEPRAAEEIVVLGCTHYPFASATINDVLAGQVLHRPVRTVDPAGALARELAVWLPAKNRAALEGMPGPADERPPEVSFLTTGRAAHFAARARQLLADKLSAVPNGLRLDEVTEVTFPVEPA